MRTRSLFLAGAVAFGLGACGGSDDPAATTEPADELDVAESLALFGDDRVGTVLKTKLTAVPKTFAELETLFKIGRKCVRTDSKEIYIVEEAQTRVNGIASKTSGILPRTVVTGCNTNIADPSSTRQSYSLMAALISDPSAPHAKQGDTMIVDQRLEVMALDEKTGLYNFYVFGADVPGSVKRVQRKPDGKIQEFSKLPKKKLVQGPSKEGCFSCHANGGPLMNEMTDPWTSWVSTRKEFTKEAGFSGETASLVTEAKSIDGASTRNSLANALEKTIEAGIAEWVEGNPATPGTGHGAETLSGFQPGGVAALLKSVFCETELNYRTAFDTVPIELFVDPDAIKGAGVLPPLVYASDIFPTLLPARSEMDKRIQIFLQKQLYLSSPTVLAVRLIDDQNDVFSDARCSLHAAVIADLPKAPADVDGAVRAVIKQKLASLVTDAPRKAYISALLAAEKTSDAPVVAARADYFTSVKARVAADVKLLETTSGRTQLKARAKARKDRAVAMFPGDASPLPILD